MDLTGLEELLALAAMGADVPRLSRPGVYRAGRALRSLRLRQMVGSPAII